LVRLLITMEVLGELPWKVETEDGYEYFNGDQLELATGTRGRPRIKPKPVKFLLKYDLDEDPIEEFSTMDEVKDRIDYLVQHERSLKRDSLIVYEVRSRKTVRASGVTRRASSTRQDNAPARPRSASQRGLARTSYLY
jgi:hypothetical protein